MIVTDNKSKCCGCGACSEACPKKAIEMAFDDIGFYHAVINRDLCIECGICERVCKYQQKPVLPELNETYAAVGMDIPLQESTSGGISASLMQSFINHVGYVCGSTMVYDGEQLSVNHICAEDMQSLQLFKGSKYVQSSTLEFYANVKNRIETGRPLLFTGTPCQIAGLKGYLRKEYNNLYTAEIVCHGVPSIQFFRDYISYVEKVKNVQIIDFQFRDKSEGWKLHGSITYRDDNGNVTKKTFEPEDSSFYQMFLNGYTYRDNCYQCPYASKYRQADITLGDYWNIDLVHPELLEQYQDFLNEEKGISCIVINNEKGKELLRKYGTGIRLLHSTYEQASRYNGQLLHPVILKPERDDILKIYKESGYVAVEEWYQKRLRKIRRKRKVRAMVPKWIKKIYRSFK